MSIQAVGLKAYTNALSNFAKAEKSAKAGTIAPAKMPENNFSEVLNSSLTKVNQLQQEKSAMITSFASGETQNVHELMISLQKAGLAMNMTAAVRNKVLEAYKELSRLQF
jgi:flagellar hook-basal body complex protein FliE